MRFAWIENRHFGSDCGMSAGSISILSIFIGSGLDPHGARRTGDP
jgi:hypothetical protein